jgi:transposase
MTNWKSLDREGRGMLLAARAKITQFQSGKWNVPSQTDAGKRYTVDPNEQAPYCNCPDFEMRGGACKHVIAVRHVKQRELFADGSETITETVQITETVKRTYPQNWPAYNAAQTCEKRQFQVLLADLCAKVETPSARVGRPRIPLSDAMFSAIFKVYSTVSGRRFMCDLADAKEHGHISRTPHYNSLFRVMEDPDVTPILRAMVEVSARPLKAVETDFAADSSGFTSSRFHRWYDHKYGTERKEHDWVKVHIMCGVKTNVVTAVEIADRNAGDSTMMPLLLNTTAKHFTLHEVSADAGYISRANAHAIDAHGATPFIAFRSNVKAHADDSPVWRRMYHLFQFNRDEFLAHYHRRSNVESTFSMIKAKFRDNVRSKSDVAMANECLCKFVCHNICCVISAIHELGIEASFGAESSLAPKVTTA